MGYSKSPEERYNIILTWECNLKCPGCLYEKRLGALHIPLKTVKKILPAITRFHEVNLGGGEPTLHPKFWEIVEMISAKKPSYIGLVTNGYSFTNSAKSTRDFFSRLGRISRQAGVNFGITVSVDDFHLRRAKGWAMGRQVEDLRARVKRVVENAPKSGGIRIGFSSALAPKQTQKQLLQKYCLPVEMTGIRRWKRNAPGGTEPQFVVAPDSRVFSHERALAEGKNPVGSLRKSRMKTILKLHRKLY